MYNVPAQETAKHRAKFLYGERRRCSDEGKTRNPFKFAGCLKLVNQSQLLMGRSSPYCGDMWRRYRCLTNFFPIIDRCFTCEDTARQNCVMIPRWDRIIDYLTRKFTPLVQRVALTRRETQNRVMSNVNTGCKYRSLTIAGLPGLTSNCKLQHVNSRTTGVVELCINDKLFSL